MRYAYLRLNEMMFQQMTGLRVKEFDKMVQEVEKAYTRSEEKRLARDDRQRAVGGGRRPELNRRDQILLTVIWLRQYPRQPVLGYLFGVSQTAVSHYVSHVLPVLEQAGLDTMRMPDPGKKRRRSLDDLLRAMPDLVVVIDSFEQKVQRPRGEEAQKPYYSGKKKAHTMKSQVCIHEDTGEIVDISESVPGRTADITLLDQSGVLSRLPDGVGGIGDLGYMGIDKRHPLGFCPRKKPRGKDRPPEDVIYNSAFSRRRIPVEMTIGRMRRYQAITQPDRHHRQLLTARTRAVAGLANRQIRSRLLH